MCRQDLGVVKLEDVHRCREVVQRMLQDEQTPEPAVNDMCMAIVELFDNSALHDHSGEPVVCEVVRVEVENHPEVVVKLHGVQYVPPHAMPDVLNCELPDLPQHGYGLAIVNALVDRYAPLEGGGVCLTKQC